MELSIRVNDELRKKLETKESELKTSRGIASDLHVQLTEAVAELERTQEQDKAGTEAWLEQLAYAQAETARAEKKRAETEASLSAELAESKKRET